MSRSIRKETSSFAFGMVGRLGGSSAGFVVLQPPHERWWFFVFCGQHFSPLARLHFLKRKLGGQTKADDMSALCQEKCTNCRQLPFAGLNIAARLIDHEGEKRRGSLWLRLRRESVAPAGPDQH